MTDLLQPSLDQLREHIPTTEPSFIPLDLTYVVYSPTSTLSLLYALVTFTPFVVFIALATIIACRREIEAVNQCFGLVLSTLVNSVLKSVLRHPRPLQSVKEGHGMPSDHAQFMGFFLLYLTLWLHTRACVTGSGRFIVVAATTTLTALVCVSRVHLGVHSEVQVVAGLAVGCALGCLYFYLSHRLLYPQYEWLLSLPPLQWLLFKDMSVVPDVLQYEYEGWLAYRQWLEGNERRGRDVRVEGVGVGEAAADSILKHKPATGKFDHRSNGRLQQ